MSEMVEQRLRAASAGLDWGERRRLLKSSIDVARKIEGRLLDEGVEILECRSVLMSGQLGPKPVARFVSHDGALGPGSRFYALETKRGLQVFRTAGGGPVGFVWPSLDDRSGWVAKRKSTGEVYHCRTRVIALRWLIDGCVK